RRNIAGIEITLNRREWSLAGRAIAAPAAGLDAHEIARRQPEALLLLYRSFFAGVPVDDREAAWLALLAALHAPGRKARAVEIGLQLARRQHAVALAESESAPEGAGAGGIRAQREFLEPDRQVGFLQLERDDA